MKKNYCYTFFLFLCTIILSGCGFHLQGEAPLAPPLHRMYLQASDPYGYLARYLKDSLKMSKVQLVSSPAEANAVLVILRDDSTQEFLSVSGTNQVRQYNLRVTVMFEITDANGRTIVSPQALTEVRPITVQASQILGSSNEANLFYQQMRRVLAYAIMNRISSKEITRIVMEAYAPHQP